MAEHAVFVLGAGASAPFGLPIGQELVAEIIGGPKVIVGSAERDRWLVSSKARAVFEARHKPRLVSFTNELRSSGLYSIDRFVQMRPEYAEEARVQISRVLVPREAGAVNGHQLLGDWHGWFINHLLLPHDDLSDLPIKFISFNYDRLFEFALISHLVSGRGMTFNDAHKRVSDLDLIHVYGALDRDFQWSDSAHQLAIGSDDDSILAASSGLSLMAEERRESVDRRKQIRETLFQASTIVFLGFGFDGLNCEVLGIERNGVFQDAIRPRRILATACGLVGRERSRVQSMLDPGRNTVILGGEDQKCEAFLRAHVDHDLLSGRA